MKTTTRIIIFLTLLIVALSVGGYFLAKSYSFQKAEAARQKTNVEVLNKNFTSYKTAYGTTIATVEVLNYTISELKANESALYARIKKTEINAKKIEAVVEIRTVTEIKKVIVYVDSTKCFAFKDEYNTINGCFTTRDSVGIYIQTRDNLDIIPEIIPKHRFLWWTWGVKGMKVNVISQNPHTKFSYLKYIEIKK